MNHKRFDCDDKQNSEKLLQCTTCSQMFHTPWSLLKHAQNVHGIGIYREQNNVITKSNLSETAKRDHKALTEMIKSAINSTLQTLAKPPPLEPTPIEETNPLMLLAEQAADESSNRCQQKSCAEICACPPGYCGAKDNDTDSSDRGPDEPLIMCTPEGQKCGPGETENCSSTNCCCNSTDKCDCGIGLVLEKCCNSVVPKKRRRHLQKHLENRRQIEHPSDVIPTGNSNSHSPSGVESINPNNFDLRGTNNTERSQTRKRKYPTTKPFSCEVCKEGFNQRIHLKKHMSKHTGIKPYKCGQCNYSTVERSHLKVHIRVHTG